MKFGEKKQVVFGADCNSRKAAKGSSLVTGWVSLLLTLNSWQFSPFEFILATICTWEGERIWSGIIYFSFNLQLSRSCLGQKCNNFDSL